MTEEQTTPSGEPDKSQPVTPEEVQPAVTAEPPLTSAEVEEGKTFAILSYALSLIGIPFFLVPLIMRNNEFSLYHAKQCMMIWLGGIAVSLIGGILTAVCIGVILLIIGPIFLIVLDIMGLVNAVKGEKKPLPLIGKWGEEWFKGLTTAR